MKIKDSKDVEHYVNYYSRSYEVVSQPDTALTYCCLKRGFNPPFKRHLAACTIAAPSTLRMTSDVFHYTIMAMLFNSTDRIVPTGTLGMKLAILQEKQGHAAVS